MARRLGVLNGRVIDLDQLNPEEVKVAGIFVTRLLREAKKAKETLNELGRVMKEPKITAKLGSISKAMYLKNPVDQTAATSSSGDVRTAADAEVNDKVFPFFHLPSELKCNILSYLDHADCLMFGLSCKDAARLFEERKESLEANPNGINSKTRKRKKTTGGKLSTSKVTKPRKKVITKNERFIVLYRLQDWMYSSRTGEQWKLCYKCIRFLRPSVRFGDVTWTGRQVDMRMEKKSAGAAMVEGFHCPYCAARDKAELVQSRQSFRELKKIFS